MAYRIQTIEDVTTKSEIGLGVDLSFGNPGIFKTLFTSNDQAKANIRNLLLTRKGERYLQPNFGTDLLNLVFEGKWSDLGDEFVNKIPIIEELNWDERILLELEFVNDRWILKQSKVAATKFPGHKISDELQRSK